MSDELKPLLHGPLNDRARSVLASGLEDGPSAEQLERAALALGLSASVALAATATAKLGSAKIPSAGLALVLKWLGTGALAGLVTAGALTLAHDRAPAPSSPSEPATPVNVVSTAPAIAPPHSTRAVAQPDLEPERTTPPASIAARPSAAPSSDLTPAPGASVARFPNRNEQLRAETALLDEARRALARGESDVALSRLGTYSERFSDPLLAPEAALLRVRALGAAGRTSEARSLAERELARGTDDAYAARIRRAAGIQAAPASSTSKPPSASF